MKSPLLGETPPSAYRDHGASWGQPTVRDTPLPCRRAARPKAHGDLAMLTLAGSLLALAITTLQPAMASTGHSPAPTSSSSVTVQDAPSDGSATSVELAVAGPRIALAHDLRRTAIRLGAVTDAGAVVLFGLRSGACYQFDRNGALERLTTTNISDQTLHPRVHTVAEYGNGSVAIHWSVPGGHGELTRLVDAGDHGPIDVALGGPLLGGLKGTRTLLFRRNGSVAARDLDSVAPARTITALVNGAPASWITAAGSASDGRFALLAKTYTSWEPVSSTTVESARDHVVLFDAKLQQVAAWPLPESIGGRALQIDYDGENALVGTGSQDADASLWWMDCATGRCQPVHLSPLQGRIDPLHFHLVSGGMLAAVDDDFAHVEFFRIR